MILRRSVLLPALLAGNALFALILVGRGPTIALVVAFAPAAAIAVGALVAGDRSILGFAALGLGLSVRVFNRPLSGSLYPADVLAVLALVTWITARLLGRENVRRRPTAPTIGVALLSFALWCGLALLRGHEHFGQRLYGEPLRLLLYAGVALSLTDLPPRKAHRGIVVVLYTGAVWMLLNTFYYMATGAPATGSADLSTGGRRYVALSVAMYLASALYLALLNLDFASTMRQRAFHLAIAGIALFQIVLSFGRTTYVAVAVGVPIIVLVSRKARETLASLLPLAAPVVVVAAILVAIAMPGLPTTMMDRLNLGVVTHNTDPSVAWRVLAVHEIMKQFHSSPLIGVGFGKGASFTLNGTTYLISQDPHNSFVWLLAAGGLFLLVSFVLVVVSCCSVAIRRLRDAEQLERVVVIWALLSLLTFLLNLASGPLLSTPDSLLAFWVLLLLPVVMPGPLQDEAQLDARRPETPLLNRTPAPVV